jgi:hypothetical protein
MDKGCVAIGPGRSTAQALIFVLLQYVGRGQPNTRENQSPVMPSHNSGYLGVTLRKSLHGQPGEPFCFYSCDHPHVRALVAEAISHAQHVVAGNGIDHKTLTDKATA